LSICIVEYFSWCDCANRRHAIIAGFSFQEVCFHEESLSLAEKIGSLRRNVAWRQTVIKRLAFFAIMFYNSLNRTDSKKSNLSRSPIFYFNLCFGLQIHSVNSVFETKQKHPLECF
jgi:hypothetical protein